MSWVQNDTAVALPITVNGAGTLNADIILSNAGSNPNFAKAGTGVLRLTNPGNTANFTVNAGALRVDDIAALGTGGLTLGGGSLQYGGPTASSPKNVT